MCAVRVLCVCCACRSKFGIQADILANITSHHKKKSGKKHKRHKKHRKQKRSSGSSTSVGSLARGDEGSSSSGSGSGSGSSSGSSNNSGGVAAFKQSGVRHQQGASQSSGAARGFEDHQLDARRGPDGEPLPVGTASPRMNLESLRRSSARSLSSRGGNAGPVGVPDPAIVQRRKRFSTSRQGSGSPMARAVLLHGTPTPSMASSPLAGMGPQFGGVLSPASNATSNPGSPMPHHHAVGHVSATGLMLQGHLTSGSLDSYTFGDSDTADSSPTAGKRVVEDQVEAGPATLHARAPVAMRQAHHNHHQQQHRHGHVLRRDHSGAAAHAATGADKPPRPHRNRPPAAAQDHLLVLESVEPDPRSHGLSIAIDSQARTSAVGPASASSSVTTPLNLPPLTPHPEGHAAAGGRGHGAAQLGVGMTAEAQISPLSQLTFFAQ